MLLSPYPYLIPNTSIPRCHILIPMFPFPDAIFSFPCSHSQVWSLLPGFCTEPIDLEQSFRPIARILGTALNERQDLRAIVCQALRLLIEGNKDNGRGRQGKWEGP